jgi:hypothetical protein
MEMNERIKELADSVGLGVRHDGIVLTKHVNAAEAFEQFAQLIVKECADIATNRYERLMNGGKAIKEHFGVEE